MVAQMRKRTKRAKSSPPPAPKKKVAGVIHSDRTYRIPAFCEELGITRQRLSDMRERGLKIREDGKYRVIVGKDYLDWCLSLPANTALEEADDAEE